MLVIVQERFDGLKLEKINLIANEFVGGFGAWVYTIV
jgi:hypothetical protein